MITMITGGARSGKSSYAAQQALSLSGHPLHVATAKVWDDEFRERVTRHQRERSEAWENVEETTRVSALALEGRVCVIDCVTLWLTNFFSEEKQDVEKCLRRFRAEVDALRSVDATFFIITNEIGMGIHADSPAGRKFTDLQGWANQYLSAVADEVVFMVSGIPLSVKRGGGAAVNIKP